MWVSQNTARVAAVASSAWSALVPLPVAAITAVAVTMPVIARLGLPPGRARRPAAAVGYGPKTLQRVLRFGRALAALDAGVDLARLALEAGYADQAHLTRECTRLAGAPPAALARARLSAAAP